jgi:TatD DNase family protein
MMKLVDAHIHLSDPECQTRLDELLEDAKKSNTVALVSNSTSYETSLSNIKLAEEHPQLVYAALGIHPTNIRELTPKEIERTRRLILDSRSCPGVVAIGEIGLDYTYLKGEKLALVEKQYEVFCEMLQLSENLSLPIVIHSRGTASEIIDILSSYNISKVMLHWFAAPLSLLSEIVERGYYVTEGPPTTYSKAIRDVVRNVPLTNLLTETDGPVRFFRSPFKGEMARPADIQLIVEAIAEVKRISALEVAEQVYENLLTFFELR